MQTQVPSRPSRIPLSDFYGDSRQDARRDTWLWLHLTKSTHSHFELNDFDAPNVRQRMEDFLSRAPGLIPDIQSKMSRLLLPEESFTWIGRDDRQISWLINHVNQRILNGTFEWPNRLVGRNLVIAMIDIWDVNLSVKEASVSLMQSYWNQHLQSDLIYRWFKEKDESARCSFIWEWIQKHHGLLAHGRPPITSYEDVLTFFDRTNLSYSDKILLIQSAKKRWSQNQYRENLKGKKQYNFILSDKAIRSLDQLSEKHGLTRAKILEILILEEKTNDIYISEKLKLLKKLDDL
jgi:hypothetical protein